MRKFVDGFFHTPSVHCESTAIRDMLNYYGLRTAELLHNKELESTSERMAESAKLWSETANLILNSSQKTKIEDINKLLSEAQQKIIQCAKIEEALFTKLLTL